VHSTSKFSNGGDIRASRNANCDKASPLQDDSCCGWIIRDRTKGVGKRSIGILNDQKQGFRCGMITRIKPDHGIGCGGVGELKCLEDINSY
jgi:hypothetical protein